MACRRPRRNGPPIRLQVKIPLPSPQQSRASGANTRVSIANDKGRGKLGRLVLAARFTIGSPFSFDHRVRSFFVPNVRAADSLVPPFEFR